MTEYTGSIVWGAAIAVKNRRPRWLKDKDCPVKWSDGDTGDISNVNRLVWTQTGHPLETIWLPADHPRYLTWRDVRAMKASTPTPTQLLSQHCNITEEQAARALAWCAENVK